MVASHLIHLSWINPCYLLFHAQDHYSFHSKNLIISGYEGSVHLSFRASHVKIIIFKMSELCKLWLIEMGQYMTYMYWYITSLVSYYRSGDIKFVDLGSTTDWWTFTLMNYVALVGACMPCAWVYYVITIIIHNRALGSNIGTYIPCNIDSTDNSYNDIY